MSMNSINPLKTFTQPKWRQVVITSAVLAALAMSTGCATKPTYHPNNTPKIIKNQAGVPNYYHVQQGDTVSGIAARYGLNYRQVGALNNLDSRYTIYTGQWLKLWSAPNNSYQGYPQATVQPDERYRFESTPSVSSPNTHQQRVPNIAQASNIGKYRLPSSNPVIRQYDANQGVLGVWFGGRQGDTVVASNSGTVLYAGDGLPEYGNLVMIRHDSEYVTAYAHNSKILVNEGDQVQVGQPIATMGSTGNSNQVALEFQVRKNGTPIDPNLVLNR